MLNQKIADLLNDQINKELYSAYLYLDFSNYYYDEGLSGYGNWYFIQAQEERDHAVLILEYLRNNGVKVTLDAIAKPDKEITSFEDPLRFGLEHERYVTSLIHNIYAECMALHDFRTMQFLDWFVKEQGEEEDNADTNLKKYQLFGSDPKGLYALDAELAARVYTAPSFTL